MKVYVAHVRLGAYVKFIGAFFSELEAKEWIARNTFDLDAAADTLKSGWKNDSAKGEMGVILKSYIKKERWDKAFDLVNGQRRVPITIAAMPIISRDVSMLIGEIRTGLLGVKVPSRIMSRLEEIEKLFGGKEI